LLSLAKKWVGEHASTLSGTHEKKGRAGRRKTNRVKNYTFQGEERIMGDLRTYAQRKDRQAVRLPLLGSSFELTTLGEKNGSWVGVKDQMGEISIPKRGLWCSRNGKSEKGEQTQ